MLVGETLPGTSLFSLGLPGQDTISETWKRFLKNGPIMNLVRFMYMNCRYFAVKRNSLGAASSTRVPTYSLAGGETGHFCHKLSIDNWEPRIPKFECY